MRLCPVKIKIPKNKYFYDFSKSFNGLVLNDSKKTRITNFEMNPVL